MRTIVIATGNEGKLKEFKDLFPQCEVLSLKDIGYTKEIIEDGLTFEENALLKAKQVSLETGRIVIADDSGLEVNALHGAPGIHSARYAGDHNTEANNQLLLKNMEGIADRRAQFVCVICMYFPDGRYVFAKGVCEGKITRFLRGTNGFGYDPCFYIEEYGKTMAELPLQIKNKISHRAKAIQRLKELMNENFSFE
ncbi:MAG: XTP/dITP diphosphatase [Anaeroplasmataceae bacterium]|nr:XTP/dITP diphosphatase [Anaeroplasmataceae bacterium]MDE6414342.1 XTP/dITP diphosphatase [Anaeroplasmataceae bacterium]